MNKSQCNGTRMAAEKIELLPALCLALLWYFARFSSVMRPLELQRQLPRIQILPDVGQPLFELKQGCRIFFLLVSATSRHIE